MSNSNSLESNSTLVNSLQALSAITQGLGHCGALTAAQVEELSAYDRCLKSGYDPAACKGLLGAANARMALTEAIDAIGGRQLTGGMGSWAVDSGVLTHTTASGRLRCRVLDASWEVSVWAGTPEPHEVGYLRGQAGEGETCVVGFARDGREDRWVPLLKICRDPWLRGLLDAYAALPEGLHAVDSTRLFLTWCDESV